MKNKIELCRVQNPESDAGLSDIVGLPEAVWSLTVCLHADVNSGNTADMMTPSVCSAAPPSRTMARELSNLVHHPIDFLHHRDDLTTLWICNIEINPRHSIYIL